MTRNFWLFILALFVAGAADHAHAADFEVTAGSTTFTKPPNGQWWQNPFDHSFDTQSPSYSIGFSGYATDWMRWRAEYTRLGQVSSNAQATNQDAYYNGVDGCVGPCPPLYTFRTEGSIRGLSLTLAPEFRLSHNIKLFAEAGLFIYLPKFYAEVAACQTCAVEWRNEYREGWQYGPQFGGGIEYKKTQFVLMVYNVAAKTPDMNAIPNWDGSVRLSIRQRF